MMKERNDVDFHDNPRTGVILSILRLSRAMRRCPPEDHREHFPPAVGRLLSCLLENSGVSSRDLCEMLDLRPSSLSEMLSRGEEAGLLLRVPDENDRRVQHISLTEEGRALALRRENRRRADDEEKTACFTEEEARQFCALSRRLASHLESLGSKRPPHPPFGREGHPGCPPPPFDGEAHPGCPPEDRSGNVPEEESPEHSPENRFPKGARFRC